MDRARGRAAQAGHAAEPARVRRRTLPALTALDEVRRSVDQMLETVAVSRSTLDHWEQAPYAYASRYLAASPLELLAELVADLAELRHLLGRPQSAGSRATLCRTSAQLAVLAGNCLHIAGNHGEAKRWYRTAALAAEEAGDITLAAHAQVEAASTTLMYGPVATALTGAEDAIGRLNLNCASACHVRGLLV